MNQIKDIPQPADDKTPPSPEAGSAWLPIETAPKDGSRILLYRPESVFVGYYGGANSGWRHNAPGLDAIWPLPTRWMSIPSLPTAEHTHNLTKRNQIKRTMSRDNVTIHRLNPEKPKGEAALCSGLGWSWDDDERKLTLYFDVEGIAEDEDGNECAAGAKVCFANCGTRMTPEKTEELVKRIEANGLEGMPAKAITPEDYEKKGYGDD